MRKAFIYIVYIVLAILVFALFLTANNYTQLVAASLLYPLLIYFGFELFVKKTFFNASEVAIAPPLSQPTTTQISQPAQKTTTSIDFDRRAFLKLIGATGLSFFLFSLVGRKVEPFFFEKPSEPKSSGSPIDDYIISNSDDGEIGYYGFTKDDGSWFIMKDDSNDGTIRYVKGETGFDGNWGKRKNLSYGQFHNVF